MVKYIGKITRILLPASLLLAVQTFLFAASTMRVNPESDLTYLGAFKLPNLIANGTSWNYGGAGMTYYPSGDPGGGSDGYPGSLFSISNKNQSYVAEFTIPVPVISHSKNLSDLPVAAILQSFTDITEGRITEQLGDVHYYPKQNLQAGDKLYWTNYEWYMPPADLCGFGWSEPDFTSLQACGKWRLGNFAAARTTKYLFDAPAGWADIYLDGKYLLAGRYRGQSGGGDGPALFAFAPWSDGNPPADGQPLVADEMLGYHVLDGKLREFSHGDSWEDGAWINAGSKAAVIFTGTKGFRTVKSGDEYYGQPGVDGYGSKGYHSEPGYPAILFYDTEDLLAVVQGKKQPDEPQPYCIMNLRDKIYSSTLRSDYIGGAAFDRERGLLYIIEKGVEAYGIYSAVPIVHVWKVSDAGAQPDMEAPSVPGAVRADLVSSNSAVISWDASTDNTKVAAYVIYRNGIPVRMISDTTFNEHIALSPNTTYYYKVSAIDIASNASEAEEIAVVTCDGVDSVKPFFSRVRVSSITFSSAVIAWMTDEPSSTGVSYGVIYSPDPRNDAEVSGYVTQHEVLLEGLSASTNYVFSIRSGDLFGNTVSEYDDLGVSHSFSTVSATNRPPEVNAMDTHLVPAGGSLQFTVSASDPDNNPLALNVLNLPAGAVFNAGANLFSWTPLPDQYGCYYIILSASDGNLTDLLHHRIEVTASGSGSAPLSPINLQIK